MGNLRENPTADPGYLPTALNVLGGLLFIAVFIRVWRTATAPVPDAGVPKPAAIKGASSFGPQDGKLFLRLGRDRELGRLRGFAQDPKVPLVALMGESGVGKTSLLRSGLPQVLKDDDVDYVYWEAVPTRAAKGLRQCLAPPPPQQTGKALSIWHEKLEFLLAEQAKASNAATKFELEKQIDEAREKIAKLGNEAPPTHEPAPERDDDETLEDLTKRFAEDGGDRRSSRGEPVGCRATGGQRDRGERRRGRQGLAGRHRHQPARPERDGI